MIGVLIIWSFLAIFVAFLLWFYANKKSSWLVLFFSFIGWLFPFFIVVLLPVDLTTTLYNFCKERNHVSEVTSCHKPFLYVSEEFLWASWRSIYWTMFFLTFIVLPMVLSYSYSGYFRPHQKLKRALRDNLLYYGAIIAISVIVIVLALISGKFGGPSSLVSVAMTAANIFGLSLIVILLSHGVIDIPRSLWISSDRRRKLRYLEFQASKVKEKLYEANQVYNECVDDILRLSMRTRFHDELRPYIDKIVEKCPIIQEDDRSEISIDQEDLNMEQLARLNRDISKAVREKEKWEWEWEALSNQAFFIQDIISNSDNPEMKFKSNLRPRGDGKFGEIVAIMEWIWYIKLEPFAKKALSVFLGAISVVVIWSEMTYAIPKIVLSIIGLIFQSADISYGAVEILSVLFLLYMAGCSIRSLFKINLFNIYNLHPYHHTTEYSLAFFASQMCRLTFPLCYNFMAMAASNSEKTLFNRREPIFTQFMGTMQLEGLQFYVPILVAVTCFLDFFQILKKLTRLLGFNEDIYSHEDEEDTWGNVDEGKIILEDARSKLERTLIDETSEELPIKLRKSIDNSYKSRNSPPRSPSATAGSSRLVHPLYQKYENLRIPKKPK